MRGIYVHIPFCIKKCLYCGFNSYGGKERIMPDYTNRLLSEIKTYKKITADSVYIGGGTPTVMPVEHIIKILSGIKENFNILPQSEITIEANPKTVNLKSLLSLKEAGINRISMGVQSLSDDELAVLGRSHNAEDALEALKLIKQAGFDNFSVDIMFGLPYQDISRLSRTVDTLLSYNPAHISAYSLSIDEGTAFEKSLPSGLPNEETERKMYWFLCERLARAGYEHYEISNFSKPNKRALHNTKYWLGEEYIGLGAGAHSYYNGIRYENIALPEEYIMSTDARQNESIIDEAEKIKEHYMLGLRLIDGIEDIGHKNTEKLIKEGLIRRNKNKICLTERGLDIANYVFAELM